MCKLFIQTNDRKFKKLVAKWRKGNSDISEEIVNAVLLAYSATLLPQTPIEECLTNILPIT